MEYFGKLMEYFANAKKNEFSFCISLTYSYLCTAIHQRKNRNGKSNLDRRPSYG